MTERLHFHFSLSCIGEGNGNPLQYSCLENPRDGGAWWAAVDGVAQSRTRLKRLSSSSSSSSIQWNITQPGEKFAWRNVDNLRYADDTTPMGESEEELKSLLMKVEEESEKAGLKNEDHGIWSHHFMANRWGNNRNSDRLYFLGLQNHCRW